MRDKLLVVSAVLVSITLGGAPVLAESGCNQQLSELDAAIADKEAKLDPRRQNMFVQMRDMAARYCDQGQTMLATKMIDGLMTQLGETSGGGEDAKPEAIPKQKLTREYLEGWWCMLAKRHERMTPVLFEPNGAQLIGQPAGDKYGMFPNADDLEQFYRQFERLIAKKPKRFVVLGSRGHELVYERGRCEGIETAR